MNPKRLRIANIFLELMIINNIINAMQCVLKKIIQSTVDIIIAQV